MAIFSRLVADSESKCRFCRSSAEVSNFEDLLAEAARLSGTVLEVIFCLILLRAASKLLPAVGVGGVVGLGTLDCLPERSRISTLLSRDDGLRSLMDTDEDSEVDVDFSFDGGLPLVSDTGFSGALGAFSAMVAADLLATMAGMMLRMLMSPGGDAGEFPVEVPLVLTVKAGDLIDGILEL